MVQPTFFSFDISWVDPVLNKYFLADRSNKTVDILDLSTFPPTLTQVVNTGFAGLHWQQRHLRSRRLLRPSTTTRRFGSATAGACFQHGLRPGAGLGA